MSAIEKEITIHPDAKRLAEHLLHQFTIDLALEEIADARMRIQSGSAFDKLLSGAQLHIECERGSS